MRFKILLVEDDESARESLKRFLEQSGFDVVAVDRGEQAVRSVREYISDFAVAIVDHHLPGISGAETIRAIRQIKPNIKIITFSGDSSAAIYEENSTAGSHSYFEKGSRDSSQKLLAYVRSFFKEFQKTAPVELSETPSEKTAYLASHGIVGVSQDLVDICRVIESGHKATETTVLILGENGVGKELIARAVHMASKRSGRFEGVNMSSFSKDLLESEMFGHKRGAFTGAFAEKKGLFELAAGGTIFLDEIGDMEIGLQAKLLRVIQEREFRPVGGERLVKVSAKIVAGTNQNLPDLVADGLFREDLYYRLKNLVIHVPPLRDRPEDIEPLVLHFLESLNQKTGIKKTIQAQTLLALHAHRWPGNVRELKHVIENVHLLSNGSEITPQDIETRIGDPQNDQPKTKWDAFRGKVDSSWRDFLTKEIRSGEGPRDTARKLGVSYSTLVSKLTSLGIAHKK